jgi:hypothetical protein
MTKNQQWKQSGSNQSFKDWLRTDLNQSVQGTVEKINIMDKYMNVDGFDSSNLDTFGYKPTLSGQTILGIPNYAFYGIAGLIVVTVFITVMSGKKDKTVSQ